MIFCEQCGNKINEGAKFCGKCGTPVASGQTEAQAEIPQAGVSANEESPAKKAFNAGMACLEADQYNEAIAHFTEAIRHKPDSAGAYYQRGYAYSLLKQYDAAIADLTAALPNANDKADYYFARGYNYCKSRQYGSAIADLDQAIRLNPNEAKYYGTRGSAYLENGDADSAYADCERGLQIDPNEETLINLAHAIDEADEQVGMSAPAATPSACTQCGAPLEAGEMFCANCGAKVGAAAQFIKNDVSSHSFSMEIEDVFTISGRGTVVTGKINAGSIKMNEEVIIIGGSQEIKTKVLFIEMFNKALKEAKAGDNVGLVLHKVNKNDVKRGDIVTAKVGAMPQYQSAPIQTQGQAGGGGVLKEGRLIMTGGFLNIMEKHGNLLLYRERLEWHGENSFVIPIEEISSVKFVDLGDCLRITLVNNEKFEFYVLDVVERKSWHDAINSVRNGTLA